MYPKILKLSTRTFPTAANAQVISRLFYSQQTARVKKYPRMISSTPLKSSMVSCANGLVAPQAAGMSLRVVGNA